MSRRGRLVASAVLVLVGLLFIGRWTTVLLAERWWAAGISGPAAEFLGQVQVLRLLLDLAGTVVASAWFIGNFFVVYRAIGSVQVSRRVANLEIHEALTSRVLLAVTIGSGLILGVLAGLGTGRWWPGVMLALQGAPFGQYDPVLGHDLGLYVAQLPLWRRAHGALLLLVLLGLGASFLLYFLVGAVRWSSRRPAVSDHARRHLGWLLAALAFTLAGGYWLEPFEAVAGISGPVRLETAAFHAVIANALTGVALAAAVVSAIWAMRGRHLLMAMAWLILVFASLVGHHVLPSFAGPAGEEVASEETLRRLERTAFALTRMEEVPVVAGATMGRTPAPVSLWSAEQVAALAEGDSTVSGPPNQTVLRVRGRRLPVWLVARMVGDTTVVNAYADDRVAPSGGPLSYRLNDTLAYPGSVRLLALPPHAVRPGAPGYRVNQDSAGIPVGSWPRRMVLAWARQAGSLFRGLPEGTHLAWHLAPHERLQALAPQLAWSTPTAHVVDDELVWLADGYVTSSTFPVVERTAWADRQISAIDVPFLAVIVARTGETMLYRRHSAGPLGRAWQEIMGSMARPWRELPPGVHAVLTFPADLFQVDARVLERPHWLNLRMVGRPGAEGSAALAPTAWRQADTVLFQVAGYEEPGERALGAFLAGYHGGAQPRLVLRRLERGDGFGSPRALDRSWSRFATFEQLGDSLRSVNTRATSSLVRLWVERFGVGAYQVIYGEGPERQRTVAWVNVAARDSLGAGRTMDEAWQNLLGMSAPLVSGGSGGRLGEAREWMAVADSALRRGDWTGFGRALDALREVLDPE